MNVAGTTLTMNGTTNVSGTINQTNTGGNAIFVGLVTINPGGAWQNTSGESVTIRGGILNNGTFNNGTGVLTFTTNNQTISGNPITSAAVTVTAITLTNTDTLTASTSLSGSGTLVNSATGTLNIGGTATITTLTATAVGNTVNGVLSMEGTATATAAPTYGPNATLQYNTATARTTGPEWITPFTASGGIIIANTGVITVTANKTLGPSAPLTINSGATLATGAYVIAVNGDVINAGTITSSPTGSITLSGGTSTHTLSGNGVYANRILNDVLGATLAGSPTVSGVLTVTNGIITTGTNSLAVTSSCLGLTSGGTSAYVLGNLTLDFPAGSNSCTFPIGVTGSYTPVTVAMTGVTSSLANSSLTARTDTPDYLATTAGAAGISASSDVNLYWTLIPGGSLAFTFYNPTFNFNSGNLDGGATTGTFIIGQYNGSAWSYPTISAATATSTAATGITQTTGFGVFVIGNRISASLTMLKTVAVISDPVNGTTNPKFIPGAVAQYTIIPTNPSGPVDINTAIITDPIPANTLLYNSPVSFTQGTTSSTLTYNPATDLSCLNNSGLTWVATPSYDPTTGCDTTSPPITNIRVNPKGTFYGSPVTPNPSFQLSFKVCVK